jgi:hypothetical protein
MIRRAAVYDALNTKQKQGKRKKHHQPKVEHASQSVAGKLGRGTLIEAHTRKQYLPTRSQLFVEKRGFTLCYC